MNDQQISGGPKTPPTPTRANPSPSSQATSLYDPKLALEFFKLGGTLEQFPNGKEIFAESERTSGFFSKGARIYLLLDGDVMLTRAGRPLDLVLPGEIFGEMAAIADAPRSATATVRKNCRVLSLNEKQFQLALQKMPMFALMLLSVMAQRLRRGMARLAAAQRRSVEALEHKGTLDRQMLVDLQQALGNPTPSTAPAGKTLFTQGAVAACMYVVTQGRIAISIDDMVIEHVGPAGAFGEMALIERSGRSATATAITDSAWLMVGRDELVDMVKMRPGFGVALMRSMSARVLHINKLLES